jgi:hypothetical protein
MYNGLDEIIDLFEAEDDVVLIGDSHNLAHSCNRVSLVKVHTEKLAEKVINMRCMGTPTTCQCIFVVFQSCYHMA